ncbi:MAG: hypothetical protein IPJ19_07940 [Planctomycetes bacterium]|nr:hypothetical protein [Planctomycetota bacterium]
MKRALPILLLLIGALAFGALWISRDNPAAESAEAPSSSLPVALPEFDSGTPETRIKFSSSAPSVRASAATQAGQTKSKQERDATPMRVGHPAAIVRVAVSFAGTHDPVRGALAALTYELEGQKPKNDRMQPLEDGRFELVVPLGAHLRGFAVCGQAVLREGARVPTNVQARFQPLCATLDETVGASGVEQSFEVEPARDLVGVVLDAESRLPVEGAVLSLWQPVGRRVRATTAADGKFQLTEPGTRQPLRLHCDGYLDVELGLEPADFGAGDPGLVVLLEHGLQVCGSVFDAHGVPVCYAELELHLRGIEAEGRAVPTEIQIDARSDDQGNFCFENVPRCARATICEQPHHDSMRAGSQRPYASLELGAVHSDVSGLFLLCRDGQEIDLRVVRSDGTPVEPSHYYCTCENPALLVELPRPWELRASGPWYFIAVGEPAQLVVYARESEDDPQHLLVGRRTLSLDRPLSEPLEVRIVLDEGLDITPEASNAPELVVDENGLIATLDLRLLDASGEPFAAGTRMEIELGGEKFREIAPVESTVRLRCHPSPWPYRARVQLGGQSRSFDLAIPTPGYSRAEERVWIVP